MYIVGILRLYPTVYIWDRRLLETQRLFVHLTKTP